MIINNDGMALIRTDANAGNIRWHSSNASTAGFRPQLVIKYYSRP
jgi:hypothetical protein